MRCDSTQSKGEVRAVVAVLRRLKLGIANAAMAAFTLHRQTDREIGNGNNDFPFRVRRNGKREARNLLHSIPFSVFLAQKFWLTKFHLQVR